MQFVGAGFVAGEAIIPEKRKSKEKKKKRRRRRKMSLKHPNEFGSINANIQGNNNKSRRNEKKKGIGSMKGKRNWNE
jgi:hypothetical protein